MAQDIGRAALIALASASAALAAACAAIAPPMHANLAGTRWTAQAIDGHAVAVGRAPSLNFDAQRHVSGTGGCNSFGGSYSASDGDLNVTQLVHTEMACTDSALMQQEAAYLSTLDAASHYVVETSGRLVISASNQRQIIFVRVG